MAPLNPFCGHHISNKIKPWNMPFSSSQKFASVLRINCFYELLFQISFIYSPCCLLKKQMLCWFLLSKCSTHWVWISTDAWFYNMIYWTLQWAQISFCHLSQMFPTSFFIWPQSSYHLSCLESWSTQDTFDKLILATYALESSLVDMQDLKTKNFS